MKRCWKSLLSGVSTVIIGVTITGATLPGTPEPSYTPEASPLHVTVTKNGYTVELTPEAATDAGLSTEQAEAAVCDGTYFFQRVSNTLEWGSQNSCSPALPAQYAPQRIDVTLEGTCSGPFCISWPVEAGPITSGDTFSRVASAATSEVCDSNELRRFRIAVHLWYGGVDYGTVRSAPWSDVDCDV
ncbi:MAG: hypothetical protein ACRCSP_08615 [Rhodoglobus sp.]